MLYSCEKCGKQFKQKSNYIVHVTKKKIPCVAIEKNENFQFFSSQKEGVPPVGREKNIENTKNKNLNRPLDIYLNEEKNINTKIEKNLNFPPSGSKKTKKCLKNEIKKNIFRPNTNLNLYAIENIQNLNNQEEINKFNETDALEINNNLTINSLDNGLFKCEFCDNEFTRKDNLKRHIETKCIHKKYQDKYDKIKKEFDEFRTKYEKMYNLMMNKNDSKSKTVNNLKNTNNNINNGSINNNNQTNSHSNNQTNNNINIYQFGKEDYSKIPNKLILKAIMSSTGAGIPCNLIEKIHFNNDYPELKNICITDINRKHALFWNGNKWIRRKYEKLGTDMLDRCLYLISDRMDDLEKIVIDKKTFGIKKKAIERLEDIDSNDSGDSENLDINHQKALEHHKFRKQASEIIEDLLYNNRDLVYNFNTLNNL